MAKQTFLEMCGAALAGCTLGAYVMDMLPHYVAVVSAILLTLSLIFLIRDKIIIPLWGLYKKWRNKK